MRVDKVTPDPYEISECEVQQTGFTAWVVWVGLPPEGKEGCQTILSKAKNGEVPRDQDFQQDLS